MEPIKHQIWPLFSYPIFAGKLNFTKKELSNYIKQLKKVNYLKSDPNNKQSSLISEDYYLLNKKPFKNLKNKVLETLNVYNDTYLKYNTKFKMTTSWVAFTPKNTHSNLHRHTNCLLSGVFYLQADKDSGYIEFNNVQDSDIQISKVKESTIYNATSFHFVPEPNVILLFPSRTYHKILKNNSGKDRISIAFNFMPCSSLGNQDSQIDFSVLDY